MTETTAPQPIDWPRVLLEQVDWHWTHQLRPRLTGLTDEEYLWEPTPGAWNVHPRGESETAIQGGSGAFTIDFAYPEPVPPPVTTIAWRLAHLIVGVLGARVHSHFGGPEADYLTFDYAGGADEALAQLDAAFAGWIEGVRSWGLAGLAEPCGPAEGPWGEHSRAELVAHINREVIHHGAEIALLRDLFTHRND
ncbi:DinB family protein [Humibacillus xanthopallidus]|uniref:DinB family protein n=1 Tax=Humibacillus xanthopallidus TaxID=412689 RepID=UPI00384CF9ED